MENKCKVICIKKCLSDTFEIANLGEFFYINYIIDDSYCKFEPFYEKWCSSPIHYSTKILYPIYDLSIIDKNNNFVNKGYFDARNFMRQADYRDSRIDEIFM